MENQEFIVLYTHQKTKKAKVWRDGTLKLCPSGNKAVLHDDKGACLESLFLKCLEVKPGADFESDRYLITVEEVKAPGRPVVQQEVIEEAPAWGSRGFVCSAWSRGCQPPGLKRKSTGFQGPRQVPKKMTVTENGESSGSFEAGTAFFPPFCSTLPLFSTVGRKEINALQTDPKSTVVVQTGESQGPFPTTSFEGSLGVPGQEEGLYAPLSSGCQHADPALATEPLRGHSSIPPCPQVSQQHMRSKAQILALLKSTPATICEEPEAELPRCSLQMQTPPVCGVGLERCTEVIGTEGPHCQQQPENAVGSRSRWAMYLSPLSSRAAASATGRDDMERQLAVQENDMNLNLEDLLVQKRMQAFGTCAEKGKKYHEDEPVDTDEYGNQEEKLEIPSFCGSSSLLVSCSSVGKGGLLLEAGICENKLAHFSGNDQRCTGEAARGVSTLGPPGQECQFAMWSLPASRHLQAESSVSHDIVDKVSESNTVSESLGSVQDPGGNGTQPFLEVTFNLSNFETSDTEENAQESSISQDAGIWVRGVLGNGNSCIQKPREGPSCQEINSETLPHLMSVGDKWTEKCFVKESLSKFCDKTCVGLDMGPCEGGNTGEAIAEDSISAAQQCSSPSTAGSVDGYVDSKEDANGSVQNIGSHCDFALLSSKSKGTEADLHTPDFLNIVTNQTSKNNDLLFHIQTLPFILGCDLDKDAQQVFPPVSDDENSIQGLDSSQDHSESAALVRKPFIRIPFTPHMKRDSEQVASPEQSISALSPVATYSLDSRREDFMVEFSEKSLRARTLPGIKRFSSLENKDFRRLPLESKAQVPHAPLPTADGPPSSLRSWSGVSCDPQEPTAGPPLSSEDKPPQAPSPGSWAPEARSAAPFLEKPGNRSWRSRWLKFQSPPPRVSAAGAEPGQRSRQASEAPTDRTRVQAIGAALRGPRPDPLPGLMAQEQGCGGQGLQEISGSELCFPSRQKLEFAPLPRRRNRVPVLFQSASHYQQTFTSCIIEHLNILLFGSAQRLHRALLKVEATSYTSLKEEKMKPAEDSLPSCHHRQPAKLILVKKEGPNQGRLFYTCDRPRAEQCKFFKWLEEVTPGRPTREVSLPSVVVNDVRSIGSYVRSQKVPLYEECQLLVRKGFDFQRKRHGKPKQFTTINPECYSEPKSKLYLKLSWKESSSTYSKDDLWVISKTLDFELDTFIACSAFFGPSSANEVELLPLKGYIPSRWPTDVVVHALWVCNASSELTTLRNIQEHLDPGTLPLTPHLLAVPAAPMTVCSRRGTAGKRFAPPASTNVRAERVLPGLGVALRLAGEAVRSHGLNEDQAAALMRTVRMLAAEEPRAPPVTVIRGVFGAGKSYLLAVVVLLFVRLFEQSDTAAVGNVQPWKLLISSSTNVAVDRVLLGLHAGSENENEQLKELQALMKEDLTPAERVCVRRSIEQHKLGTTRTLLREVRVVGVTCAACWLPCMNGLTFPVVVLDECSQMTEPTSLLPIARFECEKLILVGDPKQLPPTIQGSEAAHENGLEQTLFDRLCLMGHEPVPLRTQYRCHPAISAIANDLFYGGDLRDGVSEVERGPLVPWLPTLCFYNVTGQEQIERDNSFHNVAEASFTLKLIQSLIASGIAGCMIGVITLYKSQMYKLCRSLSAADFSHPDLKTVQVSTVDAFQGAEKEIIILSCVRTRHVGFIDSETRVNVALTRGRRHLLIVGNLACLRRNGLWGRVIQHCEGREDGLQHASQCEPQLNCFLKDYFEKQAEEKQKKKNEKEKSHSQKDTV